MTLRVLFLTSPEINYQEDLIHEGLDELLGPDNVWCYPYKDYSRFQYNLYEAAEPDAPHRQPLQPDQILAERDRFDAVVVGSVRPEAVELWREWQGLFPPLPVALLHGEEVEGWPGGLRYTHRFKMQLYPAEHSEDLSPLPLAAASRAMMPAEVERDIDVSFVMRPTVEIRLWCAELLRRAGHMVLLGADLPREQFCWLLNRSRIAISLRGVAWDTFRYWEIPYHGALLLSEPLPIVLPDNFVDGESAVFFRGPADLLDQIDTLLADPARLERIAANGRRLAHEKHTTLARARYLLTQLGVWPG